MSLSTFVKLVHKAFKFSVSRPIQRFNIYNRAKKYLGPDAKYFMPAPRAIGSLSQLGDKGVKYPHLEGYKSMNQRRLEAINKQETTNHPPALSSSQDESSRSFSLTRTDDNFIIEASDKLNVMKTVVTVGQPKVSNNLEKSNPLRPLPTSTNLPLQDLTSIWHVEKTPRGRMNLDMLQELMLNHLADENFWTPKAIAEKYNIKEEYAANLIKYYKQIRIVVSPRMMKAVDYVGRDNSHYQAAKHLIYFVDKNLRTEDDKQFDKMYLPDDELDDEIKELIDQPDALVSKSKAELRKLYKRPEPLRLAPLNKPQSLARSSNEDQKKLEPPIIESKSPP